MTIENKYYTWMLCHYSDEGNLVGFNEDEYQYIVPIYPDQYEPNYVLGVYVNPTSDPSVGVRKDFISPEEEDEIGGGMWSYSYKKPPKKAMIEAQRKLVVAVFVFEESV